MRKVGDIPHHDVLFLDALVVFVIPQLAASAKDPGNVLICFGPTNCDIVVGKRVSLAIVLEGGIAVAGKEPHAVSRRLIAHEPRPPRR
mgnify:CR=1 FL=1